MVSTWGFGQPQTSQAVLDILGRCPKLQSCKLLVEIQEGDLTNSIAECPFLQTFNLRCHGPALDISGRLLSRLSLPDLRDFTLSGLLIPPDSNTADSLQLVSSLAASSRLESISVDSELFPKSTLMDFLRGLPPTVKRLHLGNMWQPAGIVAATLDDDVLRASPDHPSFCPALQELEISHCRNVSDEALLHFIISRIPKLKRVDVKFDRERQIDILPGLESFVDDGLKVSITHIPPPPQQFSPWQGLPDAPPITWAN
jgi:hypothetical protein